MDDLTRRVGLFGVLLGAALYVTGLQKRYLLGPIVDAFEGRSHPAQLALLAVAAGAVAAVLVIRAVIRGRRLRDLRDRVALRR